MSDQERPITGIAWTPELRAQAERRQRELTDRPVVVPPDPGTLSLILGRALRHPTRGAFARRFLAGIHAPITDHTLAAMMAWMQAEGDAGRFNPINTTQDEPGATDFNSVGVKNYVDWHQGVKATVKTLDFGANHREFGYQPIRAHLRNSDHPITVVEAVERSAWGTGGLAREVLEETGEHALLTDRYLHHRLAH